MKTWHNRLQEALDARGKEWAELFEVLNQACGIKKPSVYAWKTTAEKQSSMMNADNAAIVCKWLDINHMWLFHGVLPSGLEPKDDLYEVASLYAKLKDHRKTAIREHIQALAATQEAEEDAEKIKRRSLISYQ